jgi:hypothetical protein
MGERLAGEGIHDNAGNLETWLRGSGRRLDRFLVLEKSQEKEQGRRSCKKHWD